MKNLIHKVIIAGMAVLIPAAFMLGFGAGTAETKEARPGALATEVTEVYRCEYGEEEIIIATDADHFIRLSDHTVIITDKALPEVEKEIEFVKIKERRNEKRD